MLSKIIWLKDDLQLHLLLPIEGKSSGAELESPKLHRVTLKFSWADGFLPFPADVELPWTATIAAGYQQHLHKYQESSCFAGDSH